MGKDGDHLVGDRFGLPFHLIWFVAGQWMRNDCQRKASQAKITRFRSTEWSKFVATNDGGGDTVLFQFDGVVDTPRRARPSITDGGDDRITVRESSHDRLGRAHRRVLIAFHYGELAAASTQDFLDTFQQETRVRLAIVEKTNSFAAQVNKSPCQRQLGRPRFGCGIQDFNETHEALLLNSYQLSAVSFQ
jgi:hypothetical protein